jgi:hypothetical protein
MEIEMKQLLVCLCLAVTTPVLAQTTAPKGSPTDAPPAGPSTPPADTTPAPIGSTDGTIVPPPKDLPTQSLRGTSQYTGNVHLSPLSTWLPMKYGISLGYIPSTEWTIEAELTKRTISTKLLSVDFGEIVDQRYGIQARYYPGSNSFNWIFGLFKSTFSFELGNSYISNIPGSPTATVWKFESIGPQLGLSNRFQWSNGITFGVDWFVMYIPAFNKTVDDTVIQSVTNTQDREDLDKAVKIVQGTPQFDLFRLSLGYTF